MMHPTIAMQLARLRQQEIYAERRTRAVRRRHHRQRR